MSDEDMSDSDESDIIAAGRMSRECWEAFAKEADSMAEYLESRGEHAGAWREKARTARRAAESIRLERSTGHWHCVCCLKRMS